MTAGGPFPPTPPGSDPYRGGYPGGGYPPPPVFAAGPPPRPPGGSRATKLWLAASGVVVLAAVVVIALVLVGGGGGGPQQAGGSTPPSSSSSNPSASSSTPVVDSSSAASSAGAVSSVANGVSSVGPAPGQSAPTDDALPKNSGSDSCDTDGYPDLALVSVVTVLGLTDKGAQPNSYVENVLRDCASATVRSRISELFGTSIDYHTGSDLTGADGKGPRAQYLLHDKSGSGSLKVTMTRQRDGHYEVTAYVYTP